MEPGEAIEAYYQTLRDGDSPAPYVRDGETTVKFGISESLWGGEEATAGLENQTERTAEWTVDSHNLTVDRRGETAWFADEVFMGWTDTERRIRYEFDTRWSGTLVATDAFPDWQFVGLHVSTAGDL
jgi:hypothetical protein